MAGGTYSNQTDEQTNQRRSRVRGGAHEAQQALIHTPPVSKTASNDPGDVRRYVTLTKPPKDCPSVDHERTPKDSRILSASCTILSARKCFKYATCAGASPIASSDRQEMGVDSPVPRWSISTTRYFLSSAALIHPEVAVHGAGDPKPGPPWRNRRYLSCDDDLPRTRYDTLTASPAPSLPK